MSHDSSSRPHESSTGSLLVAPLSTLQARRVCVILPTHLDQLVETLPVLHALRGRFSMASITWLVSDFLAPLVEPARDHDDLIRYRMADIKSMDRALSHRVWRLMRRLRRERFDVSIDLQGMLRSAAVGWAIAAPVRIGLSGAREGASWSYTHLAVPGRHRDAANASWAVADLLGIGHWPQVTEVALRAEEMCRVGKQLESQEDPVVVYSLGRHEECAARDRVLFTLHQAVQQACGSLCVFTPVEEALVKQTTHRPTVVPAVEGSLQTLAALLKQTDLFVSSDRGQVSLAGALGTPALEYAAQAELILLRSRRAGESHAESKGPALVDFDRLVPYLQTILLGIAPSRSQAQAA